MKKETNNIVDILNSKNLSISEIEMLSDVYEEKTGQKICLSCPSSVRYMILILKNYYNMANFKFARHAAQYKNHPTDKVSISNDTLTDEKAIEFLRTKPERIVLFSEFPKNWKSLVGMKEPETEEQKKARLEIEAEIEEVEKAKEGAKDRIGEALENEKKPTLEDLDLFSLLELRSMFPDVKAVSKKGFIEKITE